MMQQEFEKLIGREVDHELYKKIETVYSLNSVFQNKQDIADYYKKYSEIGITMLYGECIYRQDLIKNGMLPLKVYRVVIDDVDNDRAYSAYRTGTDVLSVKSKCESIEGNVLKIEDITSTVDIDITKVINILGQSEISEAAVALIAGYLSRHTACKKS